MKGRHLTAIAMAAMFTVIGPATVVRAEDRPNADTETKRMLVLVNTDQSGKVSKQDFLAFMAAEFDKLDKNKNGVLDVKDLTVAHVGPSHGFSK